MSKVRAEIERAVAVGAKGDCKRAVAALRDVLPAATNDGEQGLIEGEIANLLQREGAHDDAVAAYERALRAFLRAGDAGRALLAAQQAAVSLRLLGDLARSEAMLRGVLELMTHPDNRYKTIHALLNTLGAMAQRSARDLAETLPKMEALVAEARSLPELSPESTRLLAIQEHNLEILRRRRGG